MTLRVTVHSATGLRKADWFGKSDPYVVVKILGRGGTTKEEFKTEIVEDSLNPQWNQQKDFSSYSNGDQLSFTVMDRDPWPKPHDFLGNATLSSENFYPYGYDGGLQLQEAGSGVNARVQIKVEIIGLGLPMSGSEATGGRAYGGSMPPTATHFRPPEPLPDIPIQSIASIGSSSASPVAYGSHGLPGSYQRPQSSHAKSPPGSSGQLPSAQSSGFSSGDTGPSQSPQYQAQSIASFGGGSIGSYPPRPPVGTYGSMPMGSFPAAGTSDSTSLPSAFQAQSADTSSYAANQSLPMGSFPAEAIQSRPGSYDSLPVGSYLANQTLPMGSFPQPGSNESLPVGSYAANQSLPMGSFPRPGSNDSLPVGSYAANQSLPMGSFPRPGSSDSLPVGSYAANQSLPMGSFPADANQSLPIGSYQAISSGSLPIGSYSANANQSFPIGSFPKDQSLPMGSFPKDKHQSIPIGSFPPSRLARPGALHGEPSPADKQRRLRIIVQYARGLRAADWNGKSDPYVVCETPGVFGHRATFQTDVINNELDPVWNHEVELDYLAGAPLKFIVNDKDVWPKEDDFLGSCQLLAEDFIDGFEGELQLKDGGGDTQPSLSVIIFPPEPLQRGPPEPEAVIPDEFDTLPADRPAVPSEPAQRPSEPADRPGLTSDADMRREGPQPCWVKVRVMGAESLLDCAMGSRSECFVQAWDQYNQLLLTTPSILELDNPVWNSEHVISQDGPLVFTVHDQEQHLGTAVFDEQPPPEGIDVNLRLDRDGQFTNAVLRVQLFFLGYSDECPAEQLPQIGGDQGLEVGLQQEAWMPAPNEFGYGNISITVSEAQLHHLPEFIDLGQNPAFFVVAELADGSSRFTTPTALTTSRDLVSPVWNFKQEIRDYSGARIDFSLVIKVDSGQTGILGQCSLRLDQLYPFGFDADITISDAASGAGILGLLHVQVAVAGHSPQQGASAGPQPLQAPSNPTVPVSRVIDAAPNSRLLAQSPQPVSIAQSLIGATRATPEGSYAPFSGQSAPFNASSWQVKTSDTMASQSLATRGSSRGLAAVEHASRSEERGYTAAEYAELQGRGASRSEEGPRVYTAAEYAAMQGQGIVNGVHNGWQQTSPTVSRDPYSPTRQEYLAPMGSSVSATVEYDQGRTVTRQEYEAPRWIAPSATIGPDRSRNVTTTGVVSDGLSRGTPYATIGFDTNQNGSPNFVVSGPDRNFNGIPDYLEGSVGSGGIARGPVILGANVPMGAPAATIGFDTNYNGKPNFLVTGPDMNHNGIPDFLEGAVGGRRVVRGAAPLGMTTAVPTPTAAPRARDVYAAMTGAAAFAGAPVGIGQAQPGFQYYASPQVRVQQ